MAILDDINLALRDYQRYTGDGLPDAPVGAPLPTGDPESGVYRLRKHDLRSILVAILQAMGNESALTGLINNIDAETVARITADRNTGILNLDNIGGTGDAITAELGANGGVSNIGFNSRLLYIPTQTNTVAGPTLTIVNLEALPIRTVDNQPWPAGGFVVGRPYWLQRVGNTWRVMPDVTARDLATAIASEATARNAAIADEASARNAAISAALADFDLQLAASLWPGDYLIPIVVDAGGRAITGVDLRTQTLWERTAPAVIVAEDSDWESSPWPGDYLLTNLTDLSGRAMAGFDLRDGVFWQRGGVSGGSSGGVAAAEPVNPQALGAREVDGIIQYWSYQWGGRMYSFEEREGAVIAETPSLAVGIAAFGGGTTAVLGGGNDYPYHLLGPDGLGLEDHSEGQRVAEEYLRYQDARHDVLPTVVGITQALSSITEAEALNGSAARQALAASVQAHINMLRGVGKTLYIDRIHLSLLEGSPATSQAAADLHYGAIAREIGQELGDLTGQGSYPVPVVCQSFGTRADGTNAVILAEGRLHLTQLGRNFVVATPRYPFPLVPGSLAEHTAEAAEQIAELQNLAAMAVLGGGIWYCPDLDRATISGTTVSATFISLTDTVEIGDPANHGFTLSGVTNGVTITSASVAGEVVTLELSGVPEGDGIYLNYAYGQTGDPGDGYAANRGTLHDGWSYQSRTGATLRRYACSARTPVISV